MEGNTTLQITAIKVVIAAARGEAITAENPNLHR